jgi:hypothetical protein
MGDARVAPTIALMMPDFELRAGRRARNVRRRGISGLGLLLVIVGLLVLAVTFSSLAGRIGQLWPLALIAVGVFGVLRRPGWVDELDVLYGAQVSRSLDRPRRVFSLVLIGLGGVFLLFTTGVVDTRVIGPGLLIALGLLLVWRRAR